MFLQSPSGLAVINNLTHIAANMMLRFTSELIFNIILLIAVL